ncbi:uncharacterized protein LOC130727483 [Lotus japonicus]|uniref:uncharacterized protein LOC130727483 n=1 Tax=Lotus japonicus TaxID=34305 RepID=UPI00258A2E93|nr:uncharacterized protein LOC130727483 [Lotus japonicus]
MATKTKDTSATGKEKKPSSSIPITSTKKTTKPSSTASPSDKPTSSPSDKQIPNYLKPTISSRLESQSFKLASKSDAQNKATLNRRRSFDKPPSPSGPKQRQHTLSRQNNALVSPGPRDRVLTRSSTTLPVKTINTTKPVSERNSKTSKEGKTHPLVAKSAKKSSPIIFTPANKKVAAAGASAAKSKKTSKTITVPETTEGTHVDEPEAEVKEAVNEEEIAEVEKVEDKEQEAENVPETPPHVESEPEHEHDQKIEESEPEHEHDQKVEESDQPQIQDDHDEKVVPTVSEQEEEEAKEEKIIKDEHEEVENTIQEESNIDESQPEINHSANEEVEVKEKEEEEEGGVITEEDHKNETTNEEKTEEEEKEGVESGETSEGVKLTEGVEEGDEQSEAKEEAKEEGDEHSEAKEEAVAESPKPNQQTASVHGKKESQVSNDVIEETASKLLEARKNKVRALAGAFQTVIDYQTK